MIWGERRDDFDVLKSVTIGYNESSRRLKNSDVIEKFKKMIIYFYIFVVFSCFIFLSGSVVIAAITSCTNTSNPSVMLGAGLLAKNAVECGLKVRPYIKTSLSPGSGVVTYYLHESGVIPALEKLG